LKEGSRVIGILLILIIISTSIGGVATYYLSGREAQAVVQTSTITITKTIAETITMTTTKTVRETITVTTMKTVTETITMTTTVTPLDSDGDGIPDLKEIEYGTDPHKPNYLLFYALKKLPEDEALKFKNIENFDEYSIGLVNLYASLPHDKRASGEVNDLLKRILLDNKVDWLEKNLFDDKFVNPSPPLILSLTWMPVRENLDKIYDINVTFIARDDKTPISYAELHFIPVEYYYMIEMYGMRPEDYPKVFPPDRERVFVLTPTDGKFDELEEEFSVLITNIVGGREYRIVALVRDIAGNERIVEIKTPYIRQYENLGRKLYEKGIIVSAVYMPWNMKNIPMKGDDGPLLGNYDASDDIVQFKHIDWATGHGVNVFWISSNLNSPYEVNVIEKLLSKGGIKVGIMPGPDGRMIRGGEGLPDWAIDLNNTLNSEILIEIMKKIATYTSSPNYFRVNGRPAIYIWDESAFFNQYNTYLQIKNMFKDMSGSEPFLIAGNIPSIPTMPTDEYFKYLLQFREKGWQLVDAFTGWICFHSPSNEESIIENLEQYLPQHIQAWKDFAAQRGKYFVFTVSPGFDNSYSWGGPQTPLPRSPQKFKERLSIELSFLGNSYYKEIRVDTWNDFGEWTYVEPSRIEGFDYLFILKEILTSLIKS